ncbi:MAG TPA: hypothetical protein VEK73_01515 [Xanthobacteraceae bacterium]|nr:hypothetical protein [Xanthobacteraceae bacterium]
MTTVRLRAGIVNALLAIVSTLICYVVMEYAVFRVALPFLPLNIRPHLPDLADVLTQNSKAGYLPRDYVALLGDSNAEGLGDWLLQRGDDRAKPFHSADVIHQETGRDVVTFGKGGAGSAEAVVLLPSRAFASSRCSVFPSIEGPRQIFVYFYEGNDIEDNFRFRDVVEARYGHVDAEAIDRYLADYYVAARPWHCHAQLADLMVTMAAFAYRYHVYGVSVETERVAPGSNRLIVGGRIIAAPALQAPSLESPDDDTIRTGIDLLGHALAWLRTRFPGVPVGVVYIPAPMTVYRHAGDTVSYTLGGDIVRRAPTAQVETNHVLMRDLARDIAAAHGMEFIDATPALRAAAAADIVHGPRDWNHLNEIGYRVLGSLVAAHVKPM